MTVLMVGYCNIGFPHAHSRQITVRINCDDVVIAGGPDLFGKGQGIIVDQRGL